MFTSNCRSCNAPIFWALTPKGRKCPYDAEPASDGRYIMSSAPPQSQHPQMLDAKDYPNNPEPRYKSHFETCPNAAEHGTKDKR